MPDHFSGVARAYSAYRPRYPRALFEYLAGRVPRHQLAWDCGAGSGQATEGLTPYFDHVVASDISRTQLGAAPDTTGVFRVAASGEWSPLASACVDLIIVAQALHWLDLPAFYAEGRRVMRPDGVIAVWSYHLARLGDQRLDATFHRFYQDTVGPYWPPERQVVEDSYRSIPFPFAEIPTPSFPMEADWTLDELLGYVGTWSAVSRYRTVVGSDPVPLLAEELETLWGLPEQHRRVKWPLALRVGRPISREDP